MDGLIRQMTLSKVRGEPVMHSTERAVESNGGFLYRDSAISSYIGPVYLKYAEIVINGKKTEYALGIIAESELDDCISSVISCPDDGLLYVRPDRANTRLEGFAFNYDESYHMCMRRGDMIYLLQKVDDYDTNTVMKFLVERVIGVLTPNIMKECPVNPITGCATLDIRVAKYSEV